VKDRLPRGPVEGHPERETRPGARWPLTPPGCCAECDRGPDEGVAVFVTEQGIPFCRPCIERLAGPEAFNKMFNVFDPSSERSTEEPA
jgi:hypothetical protein